MMVMTPHFFSFFLHADVVFHDNVVLLLCLLQIGYGELCVAACSIVDRLMRCCFHV